jgi:glycosyltransferase involved in cell wall biosynthesis
VSAPALRVTLDVSAVPPDPGGAGRYTVELARALHRREDIELVAVSRRNDTARWRDGEGSVVGAAPANRLLRLTFEQLRLPGLLSGLAPAVHHSPHYTMPERARVPVVVTVHDLTFFTHPEWHESSKVRLFRRAVTVAAKRAGAIVCVSATTAARLDEVCDVQVPVFVAPHGVDHERFGPAEGSPGADDAALVGLGLDPIQHYVLFVGTIEPRKDVATLVRAFDRLAPERPGLHLVLAGQDGWGSGELDRAVAAASAKDRIRRLGYVPDDALAALLRRAAVVAYPSLEEGYGLPALEALACGTALVTTAGTSMAEMAGPAAVLARPGDAADLATALATVLDEAPGPAADRRALGLARAAERTWEASAAEHLAAYRRAAGMP